MTKTKQKKKKDFFESRWLDINWLFFSVVVGIFALCIMSFKWNDLLLLRNPHWNVPYLITALFMLETLFISWCFKYRFGKGELTEIIAVKLLAIPMSSVLATPLYLLYLGARRITKEMLIKFWHFLMLFGGIALTVSAFVLFNWGIYKLIQRKRK